MQLLPETLLCKPQGLFQRGSSMNQLCSIHHDFAATRYIPGVCVQWSQSDHNAGKQSVVLRTRYSILWPWYGQFKDRVSQSPQLLSAGCLKVAIAALRTKSKKKKKKNLRFIFIYFFTFRYWYNTLIDEPNGEPNDLKVALGEQKFFLTTCMLSGTEISWVGLNPCVWQTWTTYSFIFKSLPLGSMIII